MYTLVATRTDGETLTAAKYNADLQNHIDNQELQKTDDFSATVVQMQTNTDPGEAGSESLATDASGELARLRFAVKETKDALGITVAQWYTTPATISGLVATQGIRNLAINADYEDWRAGTAVAPFEHTLSGVGASVARDGTNFKTGTFAASVTRVTNDALLQQDAIARAGGQAYIRSRLYRYSAWVRASVAARVRLRINDGVGSTFSTYHTGGGAFERLSVSRTLNSLATALNVGLSVDTGDTSGQIDTEMLTDGGAEVAFAERPGDTTEILHDPSRFLVFYEDFEAPDNAVDGGAGAAKNLRNAWFITGGAFTVTGVGGIVRVQGNGTNAGAHGLNIGTSTTRAKPFNSSKNPTYKTRVSQFGGDVNVTRRIGLSSDPFVTGDPTDGIYIRFTGTGNIIAVARAASVETTLDTGVVPTGNVFFKIELQVTGTTNVKVFVDGVEEGNITTNIPSADLGVGAVSGVTASGKGVDVDYHYVRQER